MSGTEVETEVRGAKELAARFFRADSAFDKSIGDTMNKATTLLRGEMVRLVPKDERAAERSIRRKVEGSGSSMIGRVGPGVSGGAMPKHVLPLEGGRRVGARIQPFGLNSKLYAWVQRRMGGGIGDARHIAQAISDRGLPYRGNPRTPNPAPVFVERSLQTKNDELRQAFDDVGKDYVAEVMAGWVDFGTP